MSKKFASQGDMTEKEISFVEVGEGLWAFTAEGDPNSGVIIGDESVMIVEAQATPRLAHKVIEKVRSVTDKPISPCANSLSCCPRARRICLWRARNHHVRRSPLNGR